MAALVDRTPAWPTPGLMETPRRPERPSLPSSFTPVPALDEIAYARLARNVRAMLGIDLSQYKPAQVWRRVNGFASARGLPDPDALIERAREDGVLRQAFLDMLTINVSEFFRNPDVWALLVERFLRPMLLTQPSVRIWSAGCSLGFEPFTLVMLARETAPATPVRIVATDLDETILARAEQATFTEAQMAGVSEKRRARFFRPAGDSWTVKRDFRAMVTFRRHDLLKDPFDGPYDLICCRNVVIYFTEAAKTELYRRLCQSLRPGGILFLGATESILDSRQVGLEPAGLTMYRRPA
jgi:chemotaxis protein methyltransferase CheR